MDSTEPFNVAAFADDKTAWSIEHDRSGEPSVPDLLARIDADAIVARIDNAIACTIRPSELEAVRAIVAEAGSSVHKEGAALARILHDAEVIASHPTSDWGFSTESAGRVLLGKGLGPFDPAFF